MEELLQEAIGEGLYQIILSNPTDKEKMSKVKVRPVMLKDKLYFQETAYIGAQVFHENYDKEALIAQIMTHMSENFRQCEIETEKIKATVLVSKKGKVTINKKMAAGQKEIDWSHNRTKTYILEEGRTVPFLVDLGVQTSDGKVVKSRYDKFKQINRFLEFIEDILPTLPRERTIKIIDFGCGKSYLTFAVYYYLKILQGLDVQIIGLDLKKDVISRCNALALKYGYESLRFLQGDISTFDGAQEVDMVVTLHACDTATDYALAKAVEWKAKVILSVPCCQHEVNGQIMCEELTPALKYGLIKERMAALLTDAVRANILEEHGYEVQILEFIDMEHTPKNILIRGIRRTEKTGKHRETNVKKMTSMMNVETTLQKLMQ
ncbi:methyltransferase family protein [Kineothrix alysoides]|uniref:Methyltransferase family protein n=1 Tax=Kineothrix alysoides TaxID=1469948 RepID=A0A4R1R656_9FIRM|nr:SAM-dependent methyltransferase [Kineothrix alysoides]TCL61034.1 methyltransferase family protein [Kineothrix alysoides]